MLLMGGIMKAETMTAFSEWLENQRVMRSLSVAEFSRFLGIGDTTLRSFLRKDSPRTPERKVLTKIAETTHTQLSTLIEMVEPEMAERAASRANAEFLFELMEGLTEEQREVVEALIDELLRRNRGKGEG